MSKKLPPIHPGEILREEFMKPRGLVHHRWRPTASVSGGLRRFPRKDIPLGLGATIGWSGSAEDEKSKGKRQKSKGKNEEKRTEDAGVSPASERTED